MSASWIRHLIYAATVVVVGSSHCEGQDVSSGDAARWQRISDSLQSIDRRLQALERRPLGLADTFGRRLESLGSRRGENGFRALYTMDRHGSNVEFLVAAPGMISSATPDVSHDGKMVAFDAVAQLEHFAESKIFIYAMEGPFRGEVRDLGYGNVPSWSPDDRRVAFMLNPGNPEDAKGGIWVMNADGSDRKWLCPGWYPSWSPDGKRLCVEAIFEQPNCLHIYDFDDKTSRKLLGEKWSVEYSGATWSPDGKQLVFIGKHGGREHLAVADLATGVASIKILYTEKDPQRKLIGPATSSPDGTQIVFAIQEIDRPKAIRRSWAGTYLYSIAAEVPSAPVLLEEDEVGVINRGMKWMPDSRKIVFSSER